MAKAQRREQRRAERPYELGRTVRRRAKRIAPRPPVDRDEYRYLRGEVPDERIGAETEGRLRDLGLNR